MGLSWKKGRENAELLIKALLSCFLADSSTWEGKVYWDEGGLRVKNVTLKELELITEQYGQKIDSEDIRNALRCLKELDILEDHRALIKPSKTKTGSDQWSFLLKFPKLPDSDEKIQIPISWLFGGVTTKKQGEWDKRRQLQKSGVNSNQLSTGMTEVETSGIEQLQFFYYLPSRKYTQFIGRQRTLPLLLRHLSLESNISKINITGIGGIGKTSLAVEAAYYCKKSSQEQSDENYQYDVIVFTSLKQQEINNQGKIIRSYQRQTSCQQILNRIARTLNKTELMQLDFDNYIEEIINLLRHYKTLLIVDNLETVEDINNTIWFLEQLPNTVKVVITSREEKGVGQVNISLDTLNESALELIQYELERHNITLTQEKCSQIYDKTCQIPLAIILVISQLANHYSFEYIIENLTDGSNDIVRYCFESSVKPLKGKSSYKSLTTLALFSKIPSNATIIEIAKVVDQNQTVKDFAELQQLRLIQKGLERYEILSIIRAYVLAELKKDTDWEQELRNSWVNWYQDFVQKYGGQDEKEWHNYQELEEEWENITDVISWCINNDRYEDIKYFWQQIKSYSYLRGYQSDRLTNWSSRLEWTDWLIEKAKANNDYTMASEVMLDKAWTLTLIEKPEKLNEAIKLFAKVRRMKKHHHNPMFEINVAIDISYLYIIQQKINKSQKWLNKAKQLLTKVKATEASHPRQFIICNFYQGWVFFEQNQYKEAKTVFEISLDLAQKHQWRRAISLCEKWLCDVAIELQDFDFSEKQLNQILTIAKNNNDEVTIAYCHQSLAFLGKAKGNLQESKDYAHQAIEYFQKLGMIRGIEMTKKEFLT